MTRHDIIRMAKEVGIRLMGDGFGKPDRTDVWATQDEFECFANLVAAAEREACAALCFQMWNDSLDRRKLNHPDAEDCAAAIRARGQE
jgi:hypothetical protein